MKTSKVAFALRRVRDSAGPDSVRKTESLQTPDAVFTTGEPISSIKMAVLERWREAGQAPAQIVASHVTGGQVDMARPDDHAHCRAE